MDPELPEGGRIPTERTYILEDVPEHPERKVNGPQIANQLPEFEIPEGTQDPDGPRLVEGAKLSGPFPEDPKAEKSSLVFASFNYINSIVGSGVIGMPYALSESGMGIGILLLILVAYVTDYSLVILIEAGKIAEVTTYQDLVKASYGRTGFIVQSVFQFFYPFISLISYNIIVGDTLTKVLIRLTGISPMSVVVKREFIITTVTLLITLPLSLYRNIARLAKISLISVAMIILVSLSMIYRIPKMNDIVDTTPGAWEFARPNVASALGIMAFAFMCHHSSFLVYESLQENTQQRWNKVTHASIGASGILSLIFAVAGYVSFTGYIQGDVFENYCWKDDLMNLCRGLYALTILLTYPIECFVSREVLENMLFEQYQPQPFFRHAVLTVLIALIGFLISLTTDCLGIVLEFNGIVCAIPLAYILPAVCYIRMKEGPPFCREKWGSWAMMVGAVIVMICGMANIYLSYDTLSTCSHGQQMEYCFPKDNLTEEILTTTSLGL